MRLCLSFLFSLLLDVSVQAQWWQVQTSGIDTNLRGVSAVYVSSEKGGPIPVVWASGSNGVILRSLDQGKTWKRLHVAGGDSLDFRGIVAFNADTAYAMSSGEGEKSRIYKTTDGGETWGLQYAGQRKEFFLDAISCVSENECLALSDPVDGKFLLLTTADGEHWNSLPGDNMPAALPGEGAFAASNSGLALSGDEEIFFPTGGPAARVFHTKDRGRTWTVVETPIAHGNVSSGIFSLRLDENNRMMALGGDYKKPNSSYRAAAYSLDGGKTWQLSTRPPHGYRSSLAHIDDGRWVAVGPNGEDVTNDYAAHWKHTDSLDLNAAVILDIWKGWAVGPNGTIARFVNHYQYEIRYRHPHYKSRPATSAIAD